MKKADTPQQPDEMYSGETKGVYAVDEEGRYVLTRTAGWEPETVALSQALREFDRRAGEALERARAGVTSSLEYHMYARRMDPAMLAGAVSLFQWQVRRHFNPRRFARLRPRQLALYARVLGLDIETLRSLPDE